MWWSIFLLPLSSALGCLGLYLEGGIEGCDESCVAVVGGCLWLSRWFCGGLIGELLLDMYRCLILLLLML
jgi:hypothetical protein